jgi:hypothetical protein
MHRCLSTAIAAAFVSWFTTGSLRAGILFYTGLPQNTMSPEPSCLVLAGVGLGLCVLGLVLRSSNGRG